MKRGFNFRKFEITYREILTSISIIAAMLLIGFVISGRISQSRIDKSEKYNKAIKIENDKDMFQYGMDTNIGNAFVYGKLKAVDTVTFSEIDGEYMYVEKVEEHYNMHTETYTTTDSEGNTYVYTRTYWSWDYYDEETKECKELNFCGVNFKSNKINLPNSDYICTIDASSFVRFKYYGVNKKLKGTIFTELRGGTISDSSPFYDNSNIESTVDALNTSGFAIQIVFWIVWIILIVAVVYGFYYLDNNWLN